MTEHRAGRRYDPPPPPPEELRPPRPKPSSAIPFEYRHAAEEFGTWCDGRFSPIPVRYVGLGHPSAPRLGWPVYRCGVCGDEIFVEEARTRAVEA